MVSIKDIAKIAGVSISTVSYALNGSSKVTKETSERILAIAKELNYIPNAAARSLKKRQTKIIGVYLTEFSGAFYGQLLKGMRETLSQNGYDLIVCSGEQSHRFLPERMIDGAIILDETFSNEELIRYADLGNKLVVLDREINHPAIKQVLLDNKGGAQLAIQHLVEKGFSEIIILTGPEGSYDSNQRLYSAREIGKDLTIIEMDGDFTKSSGELAAEKLVRDYKHPVAVFCLNDEMAIGMYNYLAKTPYRVGEHFHIIGFDNIEVSQYLQPRLTTIDYSKQEWGALASEQLLKLIENHPFDNIQIFVTLFEGESAKGNSYGHN
ncbi:LacI family transcriptional regulator [Bacillus niacini]|uniref:LacI family transcriptional regulator n=1 Tax=Neobacillus niacini TaxID=86668 RepID=A0A852TK71_9BACI|nr:LacI family DNA-binding transcriptional regulator [Neobacillus niacini]NYE08096.1 LacI family transcriptional regulator [Neobacillus niacini]